MSGLSIWYALQPRYVYFPDRRGQFELACRNKSSQRACNRREKALPTNCIIEGLRWLQTWPKFLEGSEVRSKNTYILRFHLFRSTVIKPTFSFQVASPLPLCSMSFPERAPSRAVPKQSTLNGFGKGRTLVRQVRFKPLRLLTLPLPSSKRTFSQALTLSLPGVINFKFPLQPYEKYYITQYEELGFS